MSKLYTTVRATWRRIHSSFHQSLVDFETFFLLNFRVEWTENDDIKHYIVYKRKLEFLLKTNFTLNRVAAWYKIKFRDKIIVATLQDRFNGQQKLALSQCSIKQKRTTKTLLPISATYALKARF